MRSPLIICIYYDQFISNGVCVQSTQFFLA